mgnify:CR=1 FL=1
MNALPYQKGFVALVPIAAPLLFTALNNQYWSTDLSEPIASAPVVIFQYAMSPFEDWHALAWAGAFIITVFVLALAVAIAGPWLFGWTVLAAVYKALVLLVIACPCALVISTPVTIVSGLAAAARRGILIKGGIYLEEARKLKAIALDKTGTITEGKMALAEVVAAPGTDRGRLLALVGAAESGSEHPIAAAIAAGAREELGELPEVKSLTNRPGLGVEAVVNVAADAMIGRASTANSAPSGPEPTRVLVGRPSLLSDEALAWPDGLLDQAETLGAKGITVVAAGWDGQVRGLLSVADTVRPDSQRAIAALIDHDITPWMVTGDSKQVARAVARQVGIAPERVIAGVMPEDKVDIVARLQAEGQRVAMVGDGVNDAAALATAELGIAMGSGADVAMEASDLTIVSGALMGAVDAIRLSRSTLSTIKANLFWAFGYNVAAIPLAAVGLLTPLIGGLAMAASSVLVVLNSLRLRRFQPTR